jgi:pyruvate kinase
MDTSMDPKLTTPGPASQPTALARLLDALRQLQHRIQTGAHERLTQFSAINPSLGLNPSVRNLLHYLEFRSLDQRLLQRMLTEQGLSSLGRCEAHVSDAIERVIRMVQLALQVPADPADAGDSIT